MLSFGPFPLPPQVKFLGKTASPLTSLKVKQGPCNACVQGHDSSLSSACQPLWHLPKMCPLTICHCTTINVSRHCNADTDTCPNFNREIWHHNSRTLLKSQTGEAEGHPLQIIWFSLGKTEELILKTHCFHNTMYSRQI